MPAAAAKGATQARGKRQRPDGDGEADAQSARTKARLEQGAQPSSDNCPFDDGASAALGPATRSLNLDALASSPHTVAVPAKSGHEPATAVAGSADLLASPRPTSVGTLLVTIARLRKQRDQARGDLDLARSRASSLSSAGALSATTSTTSSAGAAARRSAGFAVAAIAPDVRSACQDAATAVGRLTSSALARHRRALERAVSATATGVSAASRCTAEALAGVAAGVNQSLARQAAAAAASQRRDEELAGQVRRSHAEIAGVARIAARVGEAVDAFARSRPGRDAGQATAPRAAPDDALTPLARRILGQSESFDEQHAAVAEVEQEARREEALAATGSDTAAAAAGDDARAADPTAAASEAVPAPAEPLPDAEPPAPPPPGTHSAVMGALIAAAAAAADPDAYARSLEAAAARTAVARSEASAKEALARFRRERAERLAQQSSMNRLRQACTTMLAERESLSDHVTSLHAVVAVVDEACLRLSRSEPALIPPPVLNAVHARLAAARMRSPAPAHPTGEAPASLPRGQTAAEGDAGPAPHPGVDSGASAEKSAGSGHDGVSALPLPWHFALSVGRDRRTLGAAGVASAVELLAKRATDDLYEQQRRVEELEAGAASHAEDVARLHAVEAEAERLRSQLDTANQRLADAEAAKQEDRQRHAAALKALEADRDEAATSAAERAKESRMAMRRGRDAFGKLSRVLSSATSALHGAAMHAGTLSAEEPGGDEESQSALRAALDELAASAQQACDAAQRGHADARAAFSGGGRDPAPSTPMSAVPHV